MDNLIYIFLKSLLLIGLILILLAFVIYCTLHYDSSECDVRLFLTSQTSFIYTLLFFSINLVVLLRRDQNFLLINILLFSSLIFLWFREFAFKIYNPILEAFRQGIIHPQIYNLQLVSS